MGLLVQLQLEVSLLQLQAEAMLLQLIVAFLLGIAILLAIG